MINNNEIKRTVPLFVGLAALLIAVPLRVAQYLKIIDASTGFYNKTDATVYILYFILGIAIISSLVLSYLRNKTLKPVSLSTKSVGFTVVSLFTSLTLVIEAVSQIFDYFALFESKEYLLSGMDPQKFVTANGGTLLLLQAIFGVLSAIYFFVTGVTIGLGNSDSSKYKIIALSPTIWYIFKLLYRFKKKISFVNVSDLLLELFMIVFLMMFFFWLAQINSKIDADPNKQEVTKGIFWKVFGYGIPAALLALICFLPRFILLLTGNSMYICNGYGLNASDLGVAVFIIYTCITAIKAGEKTNEE